MTYRRSGSLPSREAWIENMVASGTAVGHGSPTLHKTINNQRKIRLEGDRGRSPSAV